MKQVKFVPHQSQWTDEEFQAMVEGVENDIDGELERSSNHNCNQKCRSQGTDSST
ncbi:hypothetical protein TVAG_570800 [Trichomonas vaginalis G3]|uniref:Uncharacterized protein n=1 Tax=Trichomonas vaginalis (strain ATCC PRA-98 / G3) TaxID=412133 RepID=A2I094_TRIV3|nr:hypothetical protein TVAG_570800 [Trichomonas vaginalis G3]|eukprot:XP_001277853.1 hypothetical protein [Trichomonas vaginalis G3]